MNKEALRKELEDCWKAGCNAMLYDLGHTATNHPNRDTYIKSRLAALDDGDVAKDKVISDKSIIEGFKITSKHWQKRWFETNLILSQVSAYIGATGIATDGEGWKLEEIFSALNKWKSDEALLFASKKLIRFMEQLDSPITEDEKTIIDQIIEFRNVFNSIAEKTAPPKPLDDGQEGKGLDSKKILQNTLNGAWEEIRRLRALLETDSTGNELLRSIYQICERKGENTNWEAITKKIQERLAALPVADGEGEKVEE